MPQSPILPSGISHSLAQAVHLILPFGSAVKSSASFPGTFACIRACTRFNLINPQGLRQSGGFCVHDACQPDIIIHNLVVRAPSVQVDRHCAIVVVPVRVVVHALCLKPDFVHELESFGETSKLEGLVKLPVHDLPAFQFGVQQILDFAFS